MKSMEHKRKGYSEGNPSEIRQKYNGCHQKIDYKITCNINIFAIWQSKNALTEAFVFNNHSYQFY